MLKEMHRIMHPNGKLYILETVYRAVLEKDLNCGKAYLKENLFYNLLKEQKFSIIKDTIVTDTNTSNVVGRYLICHKL
jgi:ubiquinone/menaquinone biosynthesis C-methylase UbiE